MEEKYFVLPDEEVSEDKVKVVPAYIPPEIKEKMKNIINDEAEVRPEFCDECNSSCSSLDKDNDENETINEVSYEGVDYVSVGNGVLQKPEEEESHTEENNPGENDYENDSKDVSENDLYEEIEICYHGTESNEDLKTHEDIAPLNKESSKDYKFTYVDKLKRIHEWTDVSPESRIKEVDFLIGLKEKNDLLNDGSGIRIRIMNNGALIQPFSVGKFFFYIYICKDFPNEATDGEPLGKVYLVTPNKAEYTQNFPTDYLDIITDRSGESYINFDSAIKGWIESDRKDALSSVLYRNTVEWVNTLKLDTKHKNVGILDRLFKTVTEKNQNKLRRDKYVDGRRSLNKVPNPECSEIILSDRAAAQIFNETKDRYTTETGGLLLGHYVNGKWYVIEASDPGANAVFEVAYHESDEDYQNHVCGVISRIYKHPLVFLGMWHRHPGSLDTFSRVDDWTNSRYAQAVGNGCLSAIVNYDPDFRITFYYVETDEYLNLYYTRMDAEIGNDKIDNKEILEIASI